MGNPLGLEHIHDNIAMRQHRAFRDARRTTGVLQKGQIIAFYLRTHILTIFTDTQHFTERDRIWQLIFWHEFLHVFHHKVH